MNYKKLCERFVANSDQLNKIYYFSAIHPSATKKTKHEEYISALENEGIIIKLGKFKKKFFSYNETLNLSDNIKKITVDVKYKYKTVIEKETDINIAIQLLDDYYNKEYDKAIILSKDSDFIPIIKMIKEKKHSPQIGILKYYNGENGLISLERVCDFNLLFEKKDLRQSLFEQSIMLKNGKTITAPADWL